MKKPATTQIDPGNNIFKLRLEKGQGLVEYALILVLVAIVMMAVLLVLGPAVRQVYANVACSLDLGSDISGVTVEGAPPELTFTVHVRRATTLTFSGEVSQTDTCNGGSCSYTFSSLPTGGGEISITANQGCEILHTW